MRCMLASWWAANSTTVITQAMVPASSAWGNGTGSTVQPSCLSRSSALDTAAVTAGEQSSASHPSTTPTRVPWIDSASRP